MEIPTKANIDTTKIDWTSLTRDNFSVETDLQFSSGSHYVIPSADVKVGLVNGRGPTFEFSIETGVLSIYADDFRFSIYDLSNGNDTHHAIYSYLNMTTHSYLFL